MYELPILNDYEQFYIKAYYALANSGYADVKAYVDIHGLCEYETEELLFFLTELRGISQEIEDSKPKPKR